MYVDYFYIVCEPQFRFKISIYIIRWQPTDLSQTILSSIWSHSMPFSSFCRNSIVPTFAFPKLRFLEKTRLNQKLANKSKIAARVLLEDFKVLNIAHYISYWFTVLNSCSCSASVNCHNIVLQGLQLLLYAASADCTCHKADCKIQIS